MSTEPNYEKYSYDELCEAYDSIDRKEHPKKYSAIVTELYKRRKSKYDLESQNNNNSSDSRYYKNVRVPYLSSAPRELSNKVKLKIHFGGSFNIISRFAFIIFLVFAFIFEIFSNCYEWYYFTDYHNKKTAVITDAFYTNHEINDEPVVAYEYKFDTDFGFTGTDISFETSNQLNYERGNEVSLSISSKDPTVSRIAGLRRSISSDTTAIIFYIIGFLVLGAMLKGLLNSFHQIYLLKYGELTYCRLLSKRLTTTEINEEPVYEFAFEYRDHQNQKYIHYIRTHDYDNITDDEFELILFDPKKPKNSELVDFLPMSIRINEKGQFI